MIRLLLDEYQTIMTIIRLSLDQHQSMIGLLLDAYQTINRQLFNCVWVCVGVGVWVGLYIRPAKWRRARAGQTPTRPARLIEKTHSLLAEGRSVRASLGAIPTSLQSWQENPPLPCRRGAVESWQEKPPLPCRRGAVGPLREPSPGLWVPSQLRVRAEQGAPIPYPPGGKGEALQGCCVLYKSVQKMAKPLPLYQNRLVLDQYQTRLVLVLYQTRLVLD